MAVIGQSERVHRDAATGRRRASENVRGAIVFGRCVINNKPAFLQDADGGGVVFGDAGVEGTGLFQKKESGNRSGGTTKTDGDS